MIIAQSLANLAALFAHEHDSGQFDLYFTPKADLRMFSFRSFSSSSAWSWMERTRHLKEALH